jgi:hypothetical protein
MLSLCSLNKTTCEKTIKSGSQRQKEYEYRQQGKYEPDPTKAAAMREAYFVKRRLAVNTSYLNMKQKNKTEMLVDKFKAKSDEVTSLKKEMVQLKMIPEKNSETHNSLSADDDEGGGHGDSLWLVPQTVKLTDEQRVNMRTWLVENMKFSVEKLDELSDKMLQIKHYIYWQSLDEILKHPG